MTNIAAFFDMDLTLLDQSSGLLYFRYLRQQRLLSRRETALVFWWIVQYKLALLDFPHLIARLMAIVKGGREADTMSQTETWFKEMVAPHITEGGRQRIQEHQRQGHLAVIVSGATPYVVGPLARHLGLGDNYLCTRLEVRDGRFTGRIVEPACYGPGKVIWVERFAAERRVDLTKSYFYTDSYSDLPLLERVGHPVAVNPDRRLRRHARRRGWPIVQFYDP
jgi:HAD superfamily hydrolase (TIGR01490 family)